MKECSILKTKLQVKPKNILRIKGSIEQTLQFNEQVQRKMVRFKKTKQTKGEPSLTDESNKKNIAQIYDQVKYYENEDSDQSSSDLQIIRQLQLNQSYEKVQPCHEAKNRSKCLKLQRVVSMSFSKKIASKTGLNCSYATCKSKNSILYRQKANGAVINSQQQKEESQKTIQQSGQHKLKLKWLNKTISQTILDLIRKQQNLNLSNKKLTHQLFMEISDQLLLNCHLKALNLSYNLLQNKSIAIIVQILQHRALKYLSLRWNKLNAEGIVPLLTFLADYDTLQSLDVSYNLFTTQKPNFVQSLQTLLTQNNTLLHLNLQYCQINQSDCKAIQQIMNLKRVSLHGLHMAGNQMYFVNMFGFVESKSRTAQTSINYAANIHFRGLSAQKTQNIKRFEALNKKRTASLQKSGDLPLNHQDYSKIYDRCWLCQNWKNQAFELIYPVSSHPFQSIIQNTCFIHLSCYDYRPVIMRKVSFIKSFAIQGEYSKFIKNIDFNKSEMFKVMIAVPHQEEIKFFFSVRGQVLLNDAQTKVKYGGQVGFTYQNFIRDFINEQKTQKQYKVYLRQVNIRNVPSEVLKIESRKSMYHMLVSQNIIAKSQKIRKIQKEKGLSNEKNSSYEKTTSCLATKRSLSNSNNNLKRIKPTNQFNNEIFINNFKPRKKQHHYPDSIIRLVQSLSYGQPTKFLEQLKQINEQIQKFQIQHFQTLQKKQLFKNYVYYLRSYRNEKMSIDCMSLLNKKEISYETMLNDFAKYILSYIPTNQIQIGKAACQKRKKTSIIALQHSRQKNAKEVKFERQSDIQPKNSFDMKLEKSQPKLNKKLFTTKQVMHEQQIIRHAMTMKCLHDKFIFDKKETKLLSTLLNTNLNSTNKSFKSQNNIARPMNPCFQRIFLMDVKPSCSQIQDILFSQYNMMLRQYVLQKGVLKAAFKKISLTRDIFKDNRLKEINQIIVTYNFYHTCINYDRLLTQLVNEEFNRLQDFIDLAKYITAFPNFELNLQQNATEAIQSLLTFSMDDCVEARQAQTKLRGNENFKNKKRYGKCAQQLKQIKQELKKYNFGQMLPQNNWKFNLIAQKQAEITSYNRMAVKINVLSQVFIKAVQRMLSIAQNTNHRKNKENYKLINNSVVSNLSVFISKAIKNQKFNKLKKQEAKLKTIQVLQCFFLYAFSELVKLLIVLNHSYFQQKNACQNEEQFVGYETLLQQQKIKMLKAASKLKQANNKTRSANKSKTMAQPGNRQFYEFRANHNESIKDIDYSYNPFAYQNNQSGYSRKTNSTPICKAFKIVLLLLGQIWTSPDRKQIKEMKGKLQKQAQVALKKCQTTNLIEQEGKFY